MTQAAPDPIDGLGPDDVCWCGSEQVYGACHGDLRPASAPGDPLPPDPEDGLYLSPSTVIDRLALTRAMPPAGVPIFLPSPDPVQHPVAVSAGLARLHERPARVPTVPLADLGAMRYEVLSSLGLSSPDQLHRRLHSLSTSDRESLAYGLVDLAKAVVDRLVERAAAPERPTVLWIDDAPVAKAVGRTMFWADHYLVNDTLGSVIVEEDPSLDRLEDAIRESLELQPLVSTGVVVPVLTELAHVGVLRAAMAATEADLASGSLAPWVKEQIVVEGPTAREAIFLTIRDRDQRGTGGSFYLYGRIDPQSFIDAAPTFRTRMLGRYDPTFDYSEWIDQEKRQMAAREIQATNINLAMGEAFGGHYMASTPFEARLIGRRGRTGGEIPSALMWVDVPVLTQASPNSLARAAQEEAAVEDLRAVVRRALRGMEGSASASDRLAVGRELAEEVQRAYDSLAQTIRRERRWQVLVPGSFSLAALALGVAAGGSTLPIAVVTAALAEAAALAPYRATQLGRRSQAAYAVLLGAGRPGRGR